MLVFFKGSLAAATSLNEALLKFNNCSALEMKWQKASLFHYSVDKDVLNQLIQVLYCSVGEFLMR